jgi:hypothetical protein
MDCGSFPVPVLRHVLMLQWSWCPVTVDEFTVWLGPNQLLIRIGVALGQGLPLTAELQLHLDKKKVNQH